MHQRSSDSVRQRNALRSKAEGIDGRLIAAWPCDARIERRRFELLSRAYVEARYSSKYKITIEELEWLTERVEMLQQLVEQVCRERLEKAGLKPPDFDAT
jgi:hypothetical protein